MLNADEITYWNDTAGKNWAAWHDRIDAAFATITAAVIGISEPRSGEAALDVGCGCGATTLQLAQAVGSAGRVLGIDVSQPMLNAAGSRASAAQLANIELLLSDASNYRFESATFDLAFSRFGVMFFEHPIDAFANIRRALRPNGRIAFVCWRGLEENPWFEIPRHAVLPLVPAPPKPPVDAPGPLSFADPARVRHILAAAGFHDVRIESFDTHVVLGTRAIANDFLLQIGPASRLLDDADDATREAARERIDAVLRPHETSAGVVLGAGVWLVSASA